MPDSGRPDGAVGRLARARGSRAVWLATATAALLVVLGTTQVATGIAAWGATSQNPGSSFATGTLNAPTALTATPGVCTDPVDNNVAVAWTAATSPATGGYEIDRSTTSGGPYAAVGTVVGAATVNFTDTLPRAGASATQVFVANYNKDNVNPIDPVTNAVGTARAAGNGPGGALPAGEGMAIAPNNTVMYVTNYLGNSTTPFNLATGLPGANIATGGGSDSVAFLPDSSKAYVVNYNVNNVVPVTVATGAVGTPVATGAGPEGIAITPDGKKAYIANAPGRSVTVVTLATSATVTLTDAWAEPNGVAISPDGKTAYITDAGSDTVTPITIATNALGAKITVGNNAEGIAISSNGCYMYVTNYAANTVSVIKLATSAVTATIAVGRGPTEIALTPDGKKAFVANYTDGTVTPLDLTSNTAGAAFIVGGRANSQPDAICATPPVTPVTMYYVVHATIGNWLGPNSGQATLTLP